MISAISTLIFEFPPSAAIDSLVGLTAVARATAVAPLLTPPLHHALGLAILSSHVGLQDAAINLVSLLVEHKTALDSFKGSPIISAVVARLNDNSDHPRRITTLRLISRLTPHALLHPDLNAAGIIASFAPFLASQDEAEVELAVKAFVAITNTHDESRQASWLTGVAVQIRKMSVSTDEKTRKLGQSISQRLAQSKTGDAASNSAGMTGGKLEEDVKRHVAAILSEGKESPPSLFHYSASWLRSVAESGHERRGMLIRLGAHSAAAKCLLAQNEWSAVTACCALLAALCGNIFGAVDSQFAWLDASAQCRVTDADGHKGVIRHVDPPSKGHRHHIIAEASRSLTTIAFENSYVKSRVAKTGIIEKLVNALKEASDPKIAAIMAAPVSAALFALCCDAPANMAEAVQRGAAKALPPIIAMGPDVSNGWAARALEVVIATPLWRAPVVVVDGDVRRRHDVSLNQFAQLDAAKGGSIAGLSGALDATLVVARAASLRSLAAVCYRNSKNRVAATTSGAIVRAVGALAAPFAAVQSAAALLVGAIADDVDNVREGWNRSEVPLRLIALLRSSDANVKNAALVAVRIAATESAAAAEAMANAGVVVGCGHALLDAAEETQGAAALAVGALLSREFETAVSAWYKSAQPKIFVALIDSPRHPLAAAAACQALAQAFVSSRARSAIYGCGGAKAIVACMARRHYRAQRGALAAAAKMAEFSDGREALRAAKPFDNIARLLTSPDVLVRSTAAELVVALAATSAEKAALVDAGAIGALLVMIRSRSEANQAAAARALRVMMQRYPAAPRKFAAEGGCATLAALLCASASESVVAAGVSLLAPLAKYAAFVPGQDVLKGVAALLGAKNNAKVPFAVQEAASRHFAKMSRYDVWTAALHARGGRERLVAMLQSANSGVFAAAVDALSRFEAEEVLTDAVFSAVAKGVAAADDDARRFAVAAVKCIARFKSGRQKLVTQP